LAPFLSPAAARLFPTCFLSIAFSNIPPFRADFSFPTLVVQSSWGGVSPLLLFSLSVFLCWNGSPFPSLQSFFCKSASRQSPTHPSEESVLIVGVIVSLFPTVAGSFFFRAVFLLALFFSPFLRIQAFPRETLEEIACPPRACVASPFQTCPPPLSPRRNYSFPH